MVQIAMTKLQRHLLTDLSLDTNVYLLIPQNIKNVILLCSSRSGLQKMINICERFGIHFLVTFNDKKTQCICFSKSNDTDCGLEPLNRGLKSESTRSKVNYLSTILNQRETG